MSRVYVLAADKPVPELPPLDYYRRAVEELGYPMRPCRYEVPMEGGAKDLENLLACLRENFAPGESIELWSVWVGDVNKKRPPRFQGRLADFDKDALEQFLSAEEICFDITV